MERSPHIRLFGGPALMDGDRECPLTPTQRQFLALVYADPQGTLTREQATWLLWERGESRPTRHRIRQLIYAINNRSPAPVLERSGEALVACLPSDATEVDPSNEPPLSLLTTAPTAPFDHWLDTARARLQRLRQVSLTRRLDEAALARDFDVVDSVSSRMLSLGLGGLGPLLDLAWAMQGRGRYREAELVLRNGAGEASDRDSIDLRLALDALQAGRSLGPKRTRPSPRLAIRGRDALVGTVQRQLRETSVLGAILFGPAAIGKSTVLDLVIGDVGVRFPRQPVLRGFGERASGTAPFRLCQEMLMQPWALSQLESQPNLLIPLLRQAFPSLSEKLGLRPSTDVVLLPEPESVSREFQRLLTTMLEGRTALLPVDDLEDADAGSLRLLADLFRARTVDARLLGTVSATDVSEARAILEAILPGIRGIEFHEIGELSKRESISVLEACSPDLTHQAAERIYSALGGIPGYLIEAAETAGPRSTTLPQNAQDLVERRMVRLSGEERLLCAVLAVSGSETGIGLLAEVLERPVHKLSALIESLQEKALVVRRGDRISFRQRFLATGAYARLSKDERRAFHLRFLFAARRREVPSVSLQRHSQATGESSDLLFPAFASEATEAERRGALQEAADLWRAARASAQSHGRVHESSVKEADARIRLRQLDWAVKAVEDGLQEKQLSAGHRGTLQLRHFVAQSLSDPASVDRDRVRSLIALLAASEWPVEHAKAIETALAVADFQEDLTWAAELLSAADELEPKTPDEAVWVHLARTRHLYLGDPHKGLSSAQRAVDEAQRASVPGALSRALNRRIVAFVFRGRLSTPDGVRAVLMARETAEKTGDSRLLYDTFVNEGTWFMDIGDLDAAAGAFDKARELLGPDASPLELLTTKVNKGELLLHLGRGSEAATEFSAAIRHAGDKGAGRHLCVAGLALSALEEGRLREARNWVKEIESIEPSQRFRGNLSLVAIARARVAQVEGRTTDAISILLSFGGEMLPWMIPAALKLYLEAFRLALRSKVRLNRDQIAPPLDVAQELSLPGTGDRLLQLRDRLLN